MAILFTLVEVTPHRLRYVCYDDGETTGVPSPGTLYNTGVSNPGGDLRADASIVEGSPIDCLVSTPVVSQAAARTLLLGDGLDVVTDINTPRAHLKMTPKTIVAGGIPWSADADLGVGPSAGYPVINVFGPGAEALCYLDVEFEHTLIR